VKSAPPPTDGTREEFLTARQLAAILQVSESTVRRLAREGRIPSVRITSRLTRFNLKAVLKALDGTPQQQRTRSARRQEAEADDSQLSFTELL
jgi:excisionase family DNA binding protein